LITFYFNFLGAASSMAGLSGWRVGGYK